MIYKCLSNKNTYENESIIKKGLIIFSILSISLKQGKISPECLINRPSYTSCYLLSKNKEKDDEYLYSGYLSIYEALNNEIDLELTILSDSVILDILGNGIFQVSNINESIIKYSEFKSGNVEPWVIIYKNDQYNDQTIYKAIDSINSIFMNKEAYDVGYTLHLFSAIYLIEDLFCNRLKIENIEDYINEYINHLYKNTDCFLQDYSNVWFNHIFNDSYGYSYFSNENQKFILKKSEIAEKIKTFTSEKIIKISSELNELIAIGLDKFFSFIESKVKPGTIYTENPILKNIDNKKLCLALINIDYSFHEKAYRFFLNRYSQGQLLNRLKEESPWFKELIQTLRDINNDNSGISKFRIEGLIKKLEYVKE